MAEGGLGGGENRDFLEERKIITLVYTSKAVRFSFFDRLYSFFFQFFFIAIIFLLAVYPFSKTALRNWFKYACLSGIGSQVEKYSREKLLKRKSRWFLYAKKMTDWWVQRVRQVHQISSHKNVYRIYRNTCKEIISRIEFAPSNNRERWGTWHRADLNNFEMTLILRLANTIL